MLSHKACKITRDDDPLALWVIVTPKGLRHGAKTLGEAKRIAEKNS